MIKSNGGTALVTGASGFIGRSLIPALRGRGFGVVATSRRPRASTDGVEWRTSDLLDPASLPAVFEGARVAFYLVHGMSGGGANFRELERKTAEAFVAAAAKASVERIVYLGGPAPPGIPSEHLRSRLEVGEILRSGAVPVAELRASMVIGHGSASWQIVRDLAVPLLVLCSFVCGNLWGLMRVATGSLVVPILAHVVWDLGVLLVWPLAAHRP